jgi:hypothetical protein
VVRSADLLVNVSGSLEHPEDYRKSGRLAYIDSDPVFTQIKLARGQADFRQLLDMHNVHFSFGEHLSAAGPKDGLHWRPTRQPVVLSEWEHSLPYREVFTTVMNWTSYKPVVYNGQTYAQKDIEFLRFVELPSRIAPAVLEIAVNEGKTRHPPRTLLAHKGWLVVDPEVVCPDLESYRRYIQSSKAEWSVAKNGYVVGQPGWFSCRSACYLASGRPVVVQDTGFGAVLPVGEGLLTFTSLEQAVAGIRDVEANYASHAKAARAIAEAYFDSDKILARLIAQALGD